MSAKRLLCRWRIFCPSIAFFSERGYRGLGQSSPSFTGSVTESTSGRAVLHWGWCLFCAFWSSCGCRCTFPVDFAWFLKGEHGVWSTLSAESACKIFVFLGMVKYSAWFEGCFMSQRQRRFWQRFVYCALELVWSRRVSAEFVWQVVFHSQCCARVCVVSDFWRTQFSASPLNRFCSWVLVLLRSDESFFSPRRERRRQRNRILLWAGVICILSSLCWGSNVHIGPTKMRKCTACIIGYRLNKCDDRCAWGFDEWTTVCSQSRPATPHCNAPMLNRPVFSCCAMFCWGCPCSPLCIWKVVFRGLSGRPSRFFWQCLTEHMLSVWCSCLVGQRGVFQWRGVLINGTQIDTLGLIAASLSMVEAVSCTAVNLQMEKVVEFWKDSIVLRFDCLVVMYITKMP